MNTGNNAASSPISAPAATVPSASASTGEEWVTERSLQKLLVSSQIIAALAVPVILALIGFGVQRAIQGDTIKRDYVNLAISLLTPKKDDDPQTSPELKNWAIRLLNENSPVKLTAPEIDSIKQQGLPADASPVIRSNNRMSIDDFPEGLNKETLRAILGAMRDDTDSKLGITKENVK